MTVYAGVVSSSSQLETHISHLESRCLPLSATCPHLAARSSFLAGHSCHLTACFLDVCKNLRRRVGDTSRSSSCFRLAAYIALVLIAEAINQTLLLLPGGGVVARFPKDTPLVFKRVAMSNVAAGDPPTTGSLNGNATLAMPLRPTLALAVNASRLGPETPSLLAAERQSCDQDAPTRELCCQQGAKFIPLKEARLKKGYLFVEPKDALPGFHCFFFTLPALGLLAAGVALTEAVTGWFATPSPRGERAEAPNGEAG